jgi:hypothetical protein
MPGDRHAHAADTEVHSITDAATAHSEEMRQRMIKYAVAMGIRMVCLILIFVVDGWFKVLPVIGAVFLPWIAVIIANGSDKAEIHSDSLLDYVPMAELDAPGAGGARQAAGGDGRAYAGGASGGAAAPAEGAAAAPAGAEDVSMTLLQGELIDEEDGLADDAGDQGRAAS